MFVVKCIVIRINGQGYGSIKYILHLRMCSMSPLSTICSEVANRVLVPDPADPWPHDTLLVTLCWDLGKN